MNQYVLLTFYSDVMHLNHTQAKPLQLKVTQLASRPASELTLLLVLCISSTTSVVKQANFRKLSVLWTQRRVNADNHAFMSNNSRLFIKTTYDVFFNHNYCYCSNYI